MRERTRIEIENLGRKSKKKSKKTLKKLMKSPNLLEEFDKNDPLISESLKNQSSYEI